MFQWPRRPYAKAAILVNTSTVTRASGRGSITGGLRLAWLLVGLWQESSLIQGLTSGWMKAEMSAGATQIMQIMSWGVKC